MGAGPEWEGVGRSLMMGSGPDWESGSGSQVCSGTKKLQKTVENHDMCGLSEEHIKSILEELIKSILHRYGKLGLHRCGAG